MKDDVCGHCDKPLKDANWSVCLCDECFEDNKDRKQRTLSVDDNTGCALAILAFFVGVAVVIRALSH